MADRDRRRDNRNRQGEEDNDPLASVLAGLGGLALLGGAAYAASRAFSGGNPEQRSSRRATSAGQSHSNFTASSVTSFLHGALDNSRSASGTTITIAVDATPTRGGGLLVIPRREEVYFYSIDWSRYMTFGGEPDKFELVNALLALSIFDEYVSSYRRSGDEVVLKTDSTFCLNPGTVYRGQRNTAWNQLFSRVDAKLNGEPFEGSWRYAQRNGDDYLRIADKLSRRDCSTSSSLPVAVLGATGNRIMGYTPQNVSSGHGSVLQGIKGQVPRDCGVSVASSQMTAQGGGDCQTT